MRALADVVQQRGIAPEVLLGGGGQDALLSGPLESRIPLADYEALFARAIRLTGEPALGLYCGLQASESSFGVVGSLISHAHTLRHAIQLVRQFHPLILDGARLHLSERVGSAQLRCEFQRTRSPFDRTLAELIVAGLLRTLRAFGCAHQEIHAVCFEHARPVNDHAYRTTFRGAERFAQPFTGVEFAASVLDRPHLHRDPELRTLLHTQAERRLEQLSRPTTFVERLRALMLSKSPARGLHMALAAKELGLSTRSLRRRLAEEGTSYQAVTQSVLRESACSMLRNPDLTLDAIAHALGFADSTTFHRAFKRWTDHTPAEYRAIAFRKNVTSSRPREA